jgi:ferric-dicitrate binding protein FerR (iron transport regulator)
LSLRLRDGTRVVLAPASKLQKPTDYGVNTRTLLLEGEAYFDVAHDSVRPMVVRTERVVARDLGTRFVVRAYADASATEIVVAEGKVGVDTLVLERRQRAAVTPDRKIHLTSGVALDRYFAWTEGRLVFRDTPLREVVSQLARWYDVDIRLAGRGLGDRRLTASFDEVPVTEVFDRISGPLALEVVRDGRAYTVSAR